MKNKLAQFKSWLCWQWCLLQGFLRVWWKKAQFFAATNARNAWPTTGSGTTGVVIEGTTTIRWGTSGLLQSPKPASGFYIVTRFNQSTLVDRIPLPNGDGLTSTRVLVIDGVQWDVTVRDDTAMVPPQVGDTVSIVDGAGLIEGTTAGAIKQFTATVVNSGGETAPKAAFERVLVVENLRLVDDQTGSTQTAP